MIDVSHIPLPRTNNVWVFGQAASVTNTQWSTWNRPRGCSMVQIICIGGGGGGGGGFTAAAGNARGGGGGGASSTISLLWCPLYLLPDTLYVQVGAGGIGVGSGGGTAGTGIASIVSVYPNNVSNNILVTTTGGGGGTTGTGVANGLGGTSGAALTISNMNMAGLGVFQSISGQNGGAGGAQTGAVGTSITLPTTGILMTGGAGGAGVTAADFAGGGFNATANTLVSEQRPIAPAAGSFDGSGGPTIWRPFYAFGGCGGSASNAGVGGNGGNGGIGAGGGGGGGGTTGGRGGDGGKGIVIIIAW